MTIQLTTQGKDFNAYFITYFSRKYVGNKSVGDKTVNTITIRSNKLIPMDGFGL